MKVRRTIDTIEKACIWNDAVESVLERLSLSDEEAQKIRDDLFVTTDDKPSELSQVKGEEGL